MRSNPVPERYEQIKNRSRTDQELLGVCFAYGCYATFLVINYINQEIEVKISFKKEFREFYPLRVLTMFASYNKGQFGESFTVISF